MSTMLSAALVLAVIGCEPARGSADSAAPALQDVVQSSRPLDSAQVVAIAMKALGPVRPGTRWTVARYTLTDSGSVVEIVREALDKGTFLTGGGGVVVVNREGASRVLKLFR